MRQCHTAPEDFARVIEVLEHGDGGAAQAQAAGGGRLDLHQGGVELTAQILGQDARVVQGQDPAQLRGAASAW